jgi:dihydroorotase
MRKSGFTAIALQPNLPIIDNQVNFVQNEQVYPTFPIGALTKSEGRDMAELFDMKNCGAIALRL